ncbi:TPA: RHS repeat-associated core domain-containing protein [Vibrio vulnificus]|uniref:RHS repeat domain-containing protein n=1 Tax=Vibrio vulnificus TaxID=672 RepID=UPI000CD22BE1|nr:RHS repeat-associated core domain-containing protein [Vibrio vulnificus]POB15587.1 hypothetical protein CRN36_23885 [Vibrio vulnificus]HAS6021488.1 hypothetical protein [Vibrio vulnificus]HAS6354753.1 hypothetical protein [Vibrio vulnificus]HAS6367537.1 hypothetical protein [Vibrio vulnificus]HDY7612525.1 hypothetical protein [Vibrio vulnificus]
MPNFGHWLNREPLQEQGGINLYAYVNGDPLGYVDPDGRFAVVMFQLSRLSTRYAGLLAVAKYLTYLIGRVGKIARMFPKVAQMIKNCRKVKLIN